MNILDIIFPKRCVGCGKLGRYFCPSCISSIKIIDTPICPVCEKLAIDGVTHPGCKTRYSLDGLTSFFRYDGVVRKAIKTVKYRSVFDLAKEFVALIPADSLSQIITAVFIPIPLHASRYRDRGFNQAEVLGNVLAGQLHMPLATDILRRVKKTVPQVEMKDRNARLKNMDGVFAVNPGFDKIVLKHQNVKASKGPVVLVDDVFTTGATMRAAANVLKRAGVPFVWGVTMAR